MVSQKDVARAAGVDRSLVSLALRGHPNVAKATAERIREIAERMGYRPNAALGEAARSRWRQPADGIREIVAFVLTRAQDDHPIQKAAQARLAELGYGMTVIEPWTYTSDAALSRTLYNRGIRGLLLEQVTEFDRERNLDWQHFSVVQCGLLKRTIRTHQVTLDFPEMVNSALRRVSELGYRRAVLVLANGNKYYSDHLLLQAAAGAKEIPSFAKIVKGVIGVDYTIDNIAKAVKKIRAFRPDVIIASGPYIAGILESSPGWPDDVGIVALVGSTLSQRFAGYAPHNHLIGKLAAELLDSRLRAHAYGLPDIPYLLTFVPEWRDGETLRTR